eukprot:5719130-Prymnesium_polylepis.1
MAMWTTPSPGVPIVWEAVVLMKQPSWYALAQRWASLQGTTFSWLASRPGAGQAGLMMYMGGLVRGGSMQVSAYRIASSRAHPHAVELINKEACGQNVRICTERPNSLALLLQAMEAAEIPQLEDAIPQKRPREPTSPTDPPADEAEEGLLLSPAAKHSEDLAH